MRKQTDFTVRLYKVSAVDPSASRQMFEQLVKGEYLNNGWEVMNSSVANVDGNDIYVAVFLVKYEDAQVKK